MILVDDRCTVGPCAHKGVYRMIGACSNCHTENILILYTAGHDTVQVDCPVCGCHKVSAQRLATEDEIPAGVIASGVTSEPDD